MEPDEGYVRIDWHKGSRSDEDIKEVFEQALVELIRYEFHKLLVNQKVMSSSSEFAESWVVYDWIPRVKAAGISYGVVAVIVGQNVVTRVNTHGFLGQVETMGFTYMMQQFLFEEEAIDWLRRAV